MGVCFSCGTSLDIDRVYRTTECPSCAKAVKVCLNCRFYESGAHWDCRETISEPVRDKENANFCDFFELSRATGAPKSAAPEEARKRLGKLFEE